jgi:tRNA (guanine26-N2/guanine27-N2)-dimethyltransferase
MHRLTSFYGSAGEPEKQQEDFRAAAFKELSVVGYYPVALLAKAVRTQPPSPTKLVERLEREGFKASLTHFDPTAVKTDAPADELLRLCG